MRNMFRTAAAIAILGSVAFSLALAADEATPKYTIKEVMKKAHKDGLLKKVAGGQGTKADAEELLDLYKALGPNKPPKGDPESWKAKTVALVEAAQEVVERQSSARTSGWRKPPTAECHKAHKGS